MPANPSGTVFPTLVVLGHVATLIAVWRWMQRRKQASEGKMKIIRKKSRISVLIVSDSVFVLRAVALSLYTCATHPQFPSTPPSLSLSFFFFFSGVLKLWG
ncbi:hypothetical protein PO909_004387 [Leuciscus waleckii]